MKDEELTKNINSKPIENKNSINLQNNPEYRNWLIRSRAVVNALKLIEKFSQFGDQDEEDEFVSDDEEIEEAPTNG